MPSRAETPHPGGRRWADWAALRLVLPRVPLAVIAADDRTPPALVLEIPVHLLPEARGQALARDEPEPLANLPSVHRVAAVVAWPIAHVCDEGARGAPLCRRAARQAVLQLRLRRGRLIQHRATGPQDRDVGLLRSAAYIPGLASRGCLQDEVDGAAVVGDVQ